MSHTTEISESRIATRSSILVAGHLFEAYIKVGKIRRMSVKLYLHVLLKDPRLEDKLKLLRSRKWKKEYQSKGQNLRRVNFYPVEEDWARLSAISNATGFSRCYIFVYLMKIDLGIIRVADNSGTVRQLDLRTQTNYLICIIKVDRRLRKLIRKLQT